MNKEQALRELMRPSGPSKKEADKSNPFRLTKGATVLVALKETYHIGHILSVNSDGIADIGIDPTWEHGQWNPVRVVKNAEYAPQLPHPKTWRFAG